MIRKSRMIVALGLVTALSGSAIAFATGADDATPRILNAVGTKDSATPPSMTAKPKLDKKAYRPVAFYVEVQTDVPVPGTQACHPQTGKQCNPEAEFIQFGKNVKFDYSNATFCTAPLAGTTTEQARAACPPKSNIGDGDATVKLNESRTIDDEVVTAFAGPQKNQLRLHAYSPTLGAANTQEILGLIVKAKDPGYGRALNVPDAPDAGGDNFAITSFGVTINKSSKLVTARCKAKKFRIDREVTYDDGSKERVSAQQACKRKGGSGGGGGGGGN